MAPVVSTLRAGSGAGARSLPHRVLKQYLLLLRLYPVLTKAATSGILSAFGNLLSQIIERVRKKGRWFQNLDLTGPLRYAIFGFFFSGPLSHFLYLYLDHWIPAAIPFSGVRRLLLDRLVFAPTFLLLFFFCMNFLEDASSPGPVPLYPPRLEYIPSSSLPLGIPGFGQLLEKRRFKVNVPSVKT
ncbi:peroxisomal membrane protein 2 isoform X2 [Phascolarctos cinereus]|uniref:Peroxisomal membrane protein 2 isoform X2 n=1 Tax=Phascolarctos cinereus TaxID=38626 RepID=A0A6P5LS98_PHACI|nr:peroxisomal membrane protein 2 isoform X2 [Phascolarctos cinereus]